MTKSISTKTPNTVWRLFSSVRLTIVLMIILAAASVVGTLIPQISQPESFTFARDLSPRVFRLFTALDLFDVYHSLWFRFLIVCLALNLTVCSIDRFPGTWRLFRKTPRPDRKRPFENLPARQDFVVDAKWEQASVPVTHLLRRHYRKIVVKETPNDLFFHAEKGRYSRFGVYIVHTSVLLILIGALVGSLNGFEAFVKISEGEKTDTVQLIRKPASLKLPFEVRCDKFTVAYYDNGTPREYLSELTFLVDGKPVEKTRVRVNHPVTFRGITFYQSSYGRVPGKIVRLKISRDGNTRMVETEAGKPAPLPGGEGRFSVADVKPDFMGTGPAVLLAIQPSKGKEQHIWIFRAYEKILGMLPGPMRQSPKFDPSSFKPYTFSLIGIETGYYTGLQVSRDPGVPIVWAGCFLIIVGFLITFLTSHVRMWVRLSKKGRKIRVRVAGTSNRNPVGLEREEAHLADALRSLFEKQG